MDNAVDSDSDATFDSLDFCSTRIHGNVKTDQVERDHLIISPFKFGLATAGIMKCIILVDAVLLPWNIAKQTIRYKRSSSTMSTILLLFLFCLLVTPKRWNGKKQISGP